MRVMTFTVYICLLVLCAPVATGESSADAQSSDKAVTDTADNRQKADEKQEDIIDRVFSPLDDAVSDINRDLNKDDDSPTPESSD